MGYTPVRFITYNCNSLLGKTGDVAALAATPGTHCIIGLQGFRGTYTEPEKQVTKRRAGECVIWECRTRQVRTGRKGKANPAGVAIMAPAYMENTAQRIYTPHGP